MARRHGDAPRHAGSGRTFGEAWGPYLDQACVGTGADPSVGRFERGTAHNGMGDSAGLRRPLGVVELANARAATRKTTRWCLRRSSGGAVAALLLPARATEWSDGDGGLPGCGVWVLCYVLPAMVRGKLRGRKPWLASPELTTTTLSVVVFLGSIVVGASSSPWGFSEGNLD